MGGQLYTSSHYIAQESGLSQTRVFEVLLGEQVGFIPFQTESISVSKTHFSSPTLLITTTRPWFDDLIPCAIWRWRVCRKQTPEDVFCITLPIYYLRSNYTVGSLWANFSSLRISSFCSSDWPEFCNFHKQSTYFSFLVIIIIIVLYTGVKVLD